MKLAKLALCMLALVLAFSCKVGMISESRGKAQEAYIQFIQTQTKYENGVSVSIDNGTIFIAKVDKQTKRGVTGNIYTIPTGRHRISVKVDGRLLYEKEIFTSSQETKQISLP